jgi:flagellar biosynthetic protein FliQ
MTPETIMSMGNQAIMVSLALGAPLLLVALVVGLVISIFQAATQINEATLSFIPKLLAVFATMVIAGPWMLNQMLDYIRTLFMSIPQLVG